jgi:hypothetical protein
MKLHQSIIGFILAAGLSVSPLAADDLTLETIQKTVDDFSTSVIGAMPLNAAIGLSWSDAYIGQLISAPPHFGVGLNVGAATMELDPLKNLAASFGANLSALPFGVLPAYTIDARIGGFGLPFDIGLKGGYLPEIAALTKAGFGLNYLMLGADLRYALLDKPALPKVSVGIGFNFVEGGIGLTMGGDTEFSFGEGTSLGRQIISASAPNLNFVWGAKTLEAKVQASYSLLIFTPYIGGALGLSWSKAGYELNSTLKYNGKTITDLQGLKDDLKEAFKGTGIDGLDNISADGFSNIQTTSAKVYGRLFGGFSLNLAAFKIDLSVMCGVPNFKNFAGTLGFRFQL